MKKESQIVPSLKVNPNDLQAFRALTSITTTTTTTTPSGV